jgi:hypothetical protein
MKLCVAVLMVGALSGVAAGAQQPKGVPDMLANIASTPGTHTAFTFDRDMLQMADGYLNGGDGPVGQLNSVTVENYRYHEPAFYIPESVQALFAAYNSAGWKHLVEQNVGPKESAAPHKQLTDLWLHFHGAEIDDVTVLVRGPKQMSVVEISGALRPLDLVHLSGHFGIPKVDPGAVMIPAEPGK